MKLLEPHLYLFTCNLKVRNYYFIILSIPHSPLPSVCACCQLINRWKWKNELNLIKEIFCTPISNQMEIRWVTRFSWIWRLIETKPFLDRKWRRKVKLCGLFAHFASKADIHEHMRCLESPVLQCTKKSQQCFFWMTWEFDDWYIRFLKIPSTTMIEMQIVEVTTNEW